MGAKEEPEYAAAADTEESASTNQRTLSLEGWSVLSTTPSLHSSAVLSLLGIRFLDLPAISCCWLFRNVGVFSPVLVPVCGD